MPKGDGLTFKYGDYEFDPRPLFTVNKEILRTQSNMGLATKYNITLNGSILPTGIDLDDNVGGVNTILSGTHDLRTAFNRDFKLLYIQCGTEIDAIISGYPRILSIDVNNASDNYIRRADYSINLELASLTGVRSEPVGVDCDGSAIQDLSSSGLISVSDNFSIEFVDERAGGRLGKTFGDVEQIPSVFSISRSLSAQGDPLIPCTPKHLREHTYGGGAGEFASYKEPWERAKDYVTANLGLNAGMTGLHDLMCVSGLKIANNYRNISVNKTDNSVDATETFIIFSGQHEAIEDFEITVDRSSDNPLTSVSVNGTIQGYNTIDYNRCVAEEHSPQTDVGLTKFDNAEAAWVSISGSLYSRVQAAVAALPPHTVPVRTYTEDINPRPLSESIGYNPIVGSITYSNSYDDRPPNIVPEALVETINYTFTEPNDIFASLVVLGRGAGPLIQDVGTKGPTTRDISINAVFAATGLLISGITLAPYNKYDVYIDSFETTLNNVAGQKTYVNSDTRTWDPKAGSLSINKSWTVAKCPS